MVDHLDVSMMFDDHGFRFDKRAVIDRQRLLCIALVGVRVRGGRDRMVVDLVHELVVAIHFHCSHLDRRRLKRNYVFSWVLF